SRMRSPTGAPGRQSGPEAASALARKSSTLMPWPAAWMCTLPGFSAWSSSRQAAMKAAPSASGDAAEHMGDEGAGGGGRGGARQVGRGAARRPLPGGHRIDLEDLELSLRVLHQIDPGIAGADRLRRRDGEIAEPSVARRRLAAGAALDVGDPAGAAPDHRRD